MATAQDISMLRKDFYELVKCAQKELDVKDEDFTHLSSIVKIKSNGKLNKRCNRLFVASFLILLVFGLPSSLFLSIIRKTDFGNIAAKRFYDFFINDGDFESNVCLIPAAEIIADKFRTPVDCGECANVKGIKRVKSLSPQDFLEKYAFSMQPVIIEDAQLNWTAKEVFSFNFFKDIYSDKDALERVDRDCQFFPYQTEFSSFGEFLNMSTSRVEGKEKPWYVGWSNCDGKTANRLREHYKVPYFLPPDLDHSNTDWVFMGLPGYGANMHIDNVGTLSWQAQVKGTKKWTLQSPPECYFTCIDQMEIIVKPGDINTNKWFHQTLIIGEETSIVIGSEYY